MRVALPPAISMFAMLVVPKVAVSVGTPAVQFAPSLKLLPGGASCHVEFCPCAAKGDKATADRTMAPKCPKQRGIRADVPKSLPRFSGSLGDGALESQRVFPHLDCSYTRLLSL